MVNYAVKLEKSQPLALPRHPSASEGDFSEWCAREGVERPLAIDLFSGAGGLGSGVEAAGWRVVAAVDNDKRALETHTANFPGLALDVDMANPLEVDRFIARFGDIAIDLVVGGPPCQPFSRAGRSKIRSLVRQNGRPQLDPRKDLWRSFVRVVQALMPRAVIMENVPDMAISDDLRTVRRIADELESIGYEVEYRLLDAWRYGVPQHRKRLFVQARLDGSISWPVPVAGQTTVRDAIADLPRLGRTTGARSLEGADGRDIFDHFTRPVRDDDYEAFGLMNEKTLYSDLPDHLRRYRADSFKDKYKRLGWDQLSRTITAHIAKDGYWYIHPEEHRTITVREAARLQTFPDHFRFAGTRSDAFRQIGNAVPPRLGAAVAACAVKAPVSTRGRDASPRVLLTQWADRDRSARWWRYPGPKMTDGLAHLYAYLDLHRYGDELVLRLLTRPKLVLEDPKTPVALARKLAEVQGKSNLDLSDSQALRYGVLAGRDDLIVTKRTVQAANRLFGTELDSNVLTDGKILVAMLVGIGSGSGLRMAALDLPDFPTRWNE